jgi:tRNA_anti-like
MQQGPQMGYPQQPPPKQGMPTWLKVILVLGVLALCGVGGCVVCVGVGAKAVGDSIASASASAANEKEAAKAAKTVVKIETLLADYKGNEVKADDTYKGKYVVTGGIIQEIKKDILDKTYVVIVPTDDKDKPFVLPAVQCHPPDGDTAAAKLVKGAPIAVTGRVKGLMVHVQIEDCTWKEGSGTKGPATKK